MSEIETAVDSVLAEKQCGQDTNRVILTAAAGCSLEVLESEVHLRGVT
jgi:hypothetical protein